MMKKSIFFQVLIFSLPFIFLSQCTKNVPESVTTDISAVPSELLDLLHCHGFDTTGARQIGEHIIVENDIAIPETELRADLHRQNQLAEGGALDRQYANAAGSLVSLNSALTIRFFIDPSVSAIADGAGWVAAIRLAAADWTGVADCRVLYEETQDIGVADLIFIADNFDRNNIPVNIPNGMRNLPQSTFARACVPAGGLSGRFISINDVPPVAMNQLNRNKVCRHEIGHTLGIRHDNSSGEGSGIDACGTSFGGSVLISCTPTSDPNSVMVTGLLENVLSADDIETVQYMYPVGYNVPVITGIFSTPLGIGSLRQVTINVNAPFPQGPYHFKIERLVGESVVATHTHPCPGNATSFIAVCPAGGWGFRVRRENYGTFSLASEIVYAIIP